ncbi:LLM class flavin-dependent oxidoreductase [Allokutzneria oryzae]|uniref:LLM class flavin-dependent oxidoreductase n=1 Tax=Allokutzneria oryzae TaxID=1378989 RepID=A0ABV6A850_9PSEU
MHIGLGLPIADPRALLTWARLADAGPFRTLGLLDRVVYGNPEPLVTLAALAGATTRIRLQTEVLITPVRETSLLAKQCATLDRMSDGRFTLGVGLGGREDDYRVTDTSFVHKGRQLDAQMALLKQIWSGKEIGPKPSRPIEVLFGAFAPAAIERIARWGDGLLCAASLDYAGDLVAMLHSSWERAERPGRPRLVGQVNVALGPDSVVEQAKREITGYYSFSPRASSIAERLITTPHGIRDAVSGFADLGADEVILYCWSPAAGQVEDLARLAVDLN